MGNIINMGLYGLYFMNCHKSIWEIHGFLQSTRRCSMWCIITPCASPILYPRSSWCDDYSPCPWAPWYLMVVVAMAFHPAEAGCHFSAPLAVASMSWSGRAGRAAFFLGLNQ